ncbi:MAG: nitroreductase/quinone reductase family protein [Myxococcota bacterium]|nr:nitroreductase/quinone reductase family protein [Myxococcota bacterium]
MSAPRMPWAARALPLALACVLGCGPWGPQGILPGGPFVGSARTEPVADWSFTDAHPLIAIETRGRLLRHSVTILCVQADGDLYVMARHAPRKRWVRNVEADPRVRLEIGDALYAGRAVRVTEQAEADAVAEAMLRKYVGLDAARARFLMGPPPPGDDRAELWMWRIEPPEAAS